jgi:hypothetical protein
MALINFSSKIGDSWKKASWVVVRLLEDVQKFCARPPRWTNDTELQDLFTVSLAMKSVHLDTIEGPLRQFLISRMKELCEAIIENRDDEILEWKHGLDADDQRLFRSAVGELLVLLRSRFPDASGGAEDSNGARAPKLPV